MADVEGVGSIDGEGIWYGLTMNAWIPSARPIASATMATSSKSAATGCRLRDRGPGFLGTLAFGVVPLGLTLGREFPGGLVTGGRLGLR